jgi:hypothetical protein
MAQTASASRNGTRRTLWLCLLAGPAAWTAHLLLSYPLVPLICATGLSIVLHLVTLLTALTALAAGILALRLWDRATRPAPTAESSDTATTDYLAFSGLLLNALFLFIILAEGLPNFLVNPCV